MIAFFISVGVLCVIAAIAERKDTMRSLGFGAAGVLACLLALAAW